MFKSLIWSFLEQGGSKAILLIVQIVLARLLDPAAFGLLAILLVVTNVADSIAQSGFGTALIQKSDADEVSYDTAFWLSMGMASLMYCLLFFGAPRIASFYGMPHLVATLRVLSVVVIFNAFNSIQRSYLQRNMEFKGLFRVSLIAIVGSGALGIGCAVAGLGVWSLIIQSVSQSVLTCVVMRFVVPWTPKLRMRKRDVSELFDYGWKVCATGILNVFYTGVSEVILGKACSAAELGYYSQGRKYPNAAIGVVSNAVANVLFPALSSLREDMDEFRDCMRRGLVMGTFVLAPVSLFASVAAAPIVELLLGPEWVSAAPVFAMTSAANVVTILQLVNLRAYMALGRSDLYLGLQVAKVALGVALIGGTAIVTRDIYATATSTLACALIGIIVFDLHPAARVHGYKRGEQLRDIAPSVACAGIACAATWVVLRIDLPCLFQVALALVAYACVYVLAAKALRVDAFSEVAALLRKGLSGTL